MSATMTESVLCHWMGAPGHFTFAWKPDSDAQSEQLIRRAMDRGVVFRIVKRGPFGRTSAPVRINSVTEITDDREVIIDDEDIEKFVSSGAVVPVANQDLEDLEHLEEAPPMPRARTPREVLENETVAHRPLAGG